MGEAERPAGSGKQRWTIRRLLETTTDFLRGRGSKSPRLDAELLLSEVLGHDRVGLYVHHDQPLLESELDAYRELVRRRSNREPVAYILGRREFHGHAFRVTPDVLIPRPDTEVLVDAILAEFGADAAGTLLDVGTGSGAIALSVLAARPSFRAVATDASAAALAVAAGNAQSLGVDGRCEFREGPYFEPLARGERFDVLASNPPYIPSADIEVLEPGVKDFEPRSALDGGPSGLEIPTRIIEAAGRWVKPRGLLALEIGADQGEAVYALAEQGGVWERIEIRQDLAGHDRVLLARRREG